MNKNARTWIRALRSGMFKQCQNYLRRDDGFCCLGVACELYRRKTKTGRWDDTTGPGGDIFRFEVPAAQAGTVISNIDYLPEPVRVWLGLQSSTGIIRDRLDGKLDLADLNDGSGNAHKRKTFPEIADYIEEHAEDLFFPAKGETA